MSVTHVKWVIGIAAVIAAGAGFWLARELHSMQPHLASGTWLPQARELGPVALTDQANKPLTLDTLRGKPTLVFFGFTHCPDVCPNTLAILAEARREASLDNLEVLLISVDPQRDTPATLEKYVHAFDPQFRGATGTQTAIETIAKRFSVAVQRVELPGGGYTMDHSAAVFLLNDRAEMVAIFTPPFDGKRLAADLRTAAPHLDSR